MRNSTRLTIRVLRRLEIMTTDEGRTGKIYWSCQRYSSWYTQMYCFINPFRDSGYSSGQLFTCSFLWDEWILMSQLCINQYNAPICVLPSAAVSYFCFMPKDPDVGYYYLCMKGLKWQRYFCQMRPFYSNALNNSNKCNAACGSSVDDFVCLVIRGFHDRNEDDLTASFTQSNRSTAGRIFAIINHITGATYVTPPAVFKGLKMIHLPFHMNAAMPLSEGSI